YKSDTNSIAELVRQPSGPYQGWAKKLAASTEGLQSFGVDPTGPTGGSYLSALIDSPTFEERLHQGGLIGYIIMGLGVIGVLIAIWRFVVLAAINAKVNSQLK